jgi:hypothetical protein
MVARSHQVGVAAEEDAGVGDVDRLQPTVRPPWRRTVRLVLEPLGRPREALGLEVRQPGPGEPEPQAFEPFAREAHGGGVAGRRQHRKRLEVRAVDEIGELPDAAYLRRHVLDRGVVDEQREEWAILTARRREFRDAVLRRKLCSGEYEENGLASPCALVQPIEPALARDQTALRIDVEEEVVPAACDQPIAQGQGLRVVRARMADEDPRHGL